MRDRELATREVFRGDLGECFLHLNRAVQQQSVGNSQLERLAREHMASFCGVSAITAARWLKGSVCPGGIIGLFAISYLELCGYRIVSWERAATSTRSFVDLISYRCVTVEEARQILGYANLGGLLRVLSGRGGLTAKISSLMYEACKSHRTALQQLKVRARETHVVIIDAVQSASDTKHQTTNQINRAALISHLAKSSSALNTAMAALSELQVHLTALSQCVENPEG